jgi:hypothetical protein
LQCAVELGVLEFVNACSKFIYLEALGQDIEKSGENGAGGKVKSTRELRADTKLVHLLRNAAEAVAAEDGWANLGAVGQQISNQASFDPRNYGCKKLSDLVEATALFEVKQEDKKVLIRDRRA